MMVVEFKLGREPVPNITIDGERVDILTGCSWSIEVGMIEFAQPFARPARLPHPTRIDVSFVDTDGVRYAISGVGTISTTINGDGGLVRCGSFDVAGFEMSAT